MNVIRFSVSSEKFTEFRTGLQAFHQMPSDAFLMQNAVF